ncbi:MAG: SWIM zinc finger family protein [Candidatus Heimdallarchaeota archaeon]|nr:SWIM zinc finger family protein [Candidatus Heimdallarchaeota archaeon]
MASLDTRLKHFQTKLRKVKNGIRPKNLEGKFGNKWWSKKWLESLEFFVNDKRIVQGRFYAREGQIRSLVIDRGSIQAKVQGTKIKPYSVTIKLQVLTDEAWQDILEQMAKNAMLFSKLLIDKFPEDLEKIFSQFNYPLFPENTNDLLTSCTCADWANPCKHTAAVFYILSDFIEYDPFNLLFIRGKSRIEIREILKQYQRIITIQEDKSKRKIEKIPRYSNQVEKRIDLASFWKSNKKVKLTDIVKITKLERETSNFDDFTEPKLVELLNLSYKKASEIVNNKLTKLSYEND